MKKKLAGWWKLIFFLLIAVFAVTMLGYSMGAEKVRAKGAAINIDRSADYYLFKVDDKSALYYKPSNDDASLVKYEEAFPLFKPLGKYEYGSEIFNGPVGKSGDWIYNMTPNVYDKGRTIAYNLKTGEVFTKPEPANFDSKDFPNYLLEKGITDNPANKITAQNLNQFEQLSVPKESAIMLVSAFGFLIVLWLLVLPFAFRKVKV